MVGGKLLSRIKYSCGGGELSPVFYRFLRLHTGFLIFSGLPGVFINTFLISQTGDMNVSLAFNAFTYFATGVGMYLSSGLLHRFNPGVVALIGIILNNFLYLQLMILGTSAAQYVLLLGLTNGISAAFYWISYSQLLTDYTSLHNRDSGLAMLSISSSVVNLIVPFISGAVISAIGGLPGYNAVFGLAFLMATVTAVGYIRLPKPEYPALGRAHHRIAIAHAWGSKCLQFCMLSEMFKGLRDGAFIFILNILLYQFINSEVLVGFNTFLSSAAAIASFIIISKFIRANNRLKYMKIATAALLAYSILAVFELNPFVLILFTVVNSFFSGFILNSSFTNFLDALQVVPGSPEKRPELFALKEVYLATGRCLGLLVVGAANFFSGNDTRWQAIALALLTLSQVGTVLMCRCSEKCIRQFSEQEEPREPACV